MLLATLRAFRLPDFSRSGDGQFVGRLQRLLPAGLQGHGALRQRHVPELRCAPAGALCRPSWVAKRTGAYRAVDVHNVFARTGI